MLVVRSQTSLFRRVIRSFAVGALLCSAMSGHAAMLTRSVGFDVLSRVNGNEPQLNFRALLPRFDPALGTLNQVDIAYNFDLDLNVTISNRTLNPVTTTLGPTSLSIDGPRFFDRFASITPTVASTNIDETLNAPAGTQRQFGSITLVLPGRAATTTTLDRTFSRTSRPLQIRNIVLRPQGNVAPFVGLDDMILDFRAYTRNALNLPDTGSFLSGVRSSTLFTLDGSVDVTYDYTAAAPPPVAVDAPAPLVLAGMGLLALGMARRRCAPTQRSRS